jgi:hypothetical protein
MSVSLEMASSVRPERSRSSPSVSRSRTMSPVSSICEPSRRRARASWYARIPSPWVVGGTSAAGGVAGATATWAATAGVAGVAGVADEDVVGE